MRGMQQGRKEMRLCAIMRKNVISFVQEDTPSYFTSSYYAANEHWPFKCFNCDVHSGGDSYKVSSK